MTPAPEMLPVTAADGVRSRLQVYAPPEPRAVLLFGAGLGIEASYYAPFAEGLAARGVAVVLADSRGNGSSSIRPGRHVDFGYRELIEEDLPAAIAVVRERFDPCPLFVGGHSLAAQVTTLAAPQLPAAVRGLVLVAAGSLFHANWTGRMAIYVRVASRLFPLVSRALGWFPGRVFGFGGREARSLMLDWGQCAASGRYVLRGSDRDWEAAMATATVPAVAVTIRGDTWAPPRSMRHLTDKLRAAEVTHRHVAIDGTGKGLPHFRWARRPQPVIDAIEAWIDAQLATVPEASRERS